MGLEHRSFERTTPTPELPDWEITEGERVVRNAEGEIVGDIFLVQDEQSDAPLAEVYFTEIPDVDYSHPDREMVTGVLVYRRLDEKNPDGEHLYAETLSGHVRGRAYGSKEFILAAAALDPYRPTDEQLAKLEQYQPMEDE